MFKKISHTITLVLKRIIFDPVLNESSLELKGKIAILNSICLVILFFLTPGIIQNYIPGTHSQVFYTGAMALAIFLLFISLKITKRIELHVNMFLFLITFASLYLVYMDGYSYFGILLIFSYPLITFFFLSPKKGLVLNSILFVLMLILIMNTKLPFREAWYPMAFSTRLLVGYFMVLISSFAIVQVYTHTWQKLEKSALTDKLTMLPNRTYIYQYLNQLIKITERSQANFSVFFLDLDKFKEINDSLGHKTGDMVLISIAERLRNSVRSNDLVARLGGDEFVIIMSDIKDEISPVILANKLITVVKEGISIGVREYFLSISIGIANYPMDGVKTDDLLKKADAAMYQAKNNGKDCYRFFCQEQDELLKRKLQIEYNLRNALENNEFRMVMQPKINTVTERICGFEALLRWTSPNLGRVDPDVFIPVAEECGIIHSLGIWIFRESLRIFEKLLLESSVDLQLSVNLSPVQLYDRNFVSLVSQIVEETQVNIKNIEFEITEGLLLKNNSELRNALTKLTDCGFKLAIDDFGTGYSSLSYLKRFKVHTLKIDKSFIQYMLKDNDYLEIVKVIISMAKIFEITTVAEGVEEIDELKILKDLGCDQIQGYYFSKPLEFAEIVEFMHRELSGIKKRLIEISIN